MAAQAEVGAAGAGTAAAGAEAAPVAPTPSLYDTLIPKIPDVRAEDIQARFKVKSLPKIKGCPSYQPLDEIREMLQRSATAVESSLGGRNHGHLGLVMKDALYQTETDRTAFTILASGGLLPTFPPNATEAKKRMAVAEFIVRAKDIKKPT